MGPLQGNDGAPYVSTGHLPSPEQVRRSVDEPLDAYGNSVKGQLAARFLSRRLGLSLFASEPEA